jgi:hypothetical protein
MRVAKRRTLAMSRVRESLRIEAALLSEMCVIGEGRGR